jgi:hypothetical protein
MRASTVYRLQPRTVCMCRHGKLTRHACRHAHGAQRVHEEDGKARARRIARCHDLRKHGGYPGRD